MSTCARLSNRWQFFESGLHRIGYVLAGALPDWPRLACRPYRKHRRRALRHAVGAAEGRTVLHQKHQSTATSFRRVVIRLLIESHRRQTLQIERSRLLGHVVDEHTDRGPEDACG